MDQGESPVFPWHTLARRGNFLGMWKVKQIWQRETETETSTTVDQHETQEIIYLERIEDHLT